jgi:hypothetical protein
MQVRTVVSSIEMIEVLEESGFLIISHIEII